MPLSNLKNLRDEMQDNEKAVVVFRFNYKNVDYFVAICLLTDEDRKKVEAKYALVRLCFMKADNLNDFLDCYANSNRFSAGMTELRHFLGVEYQPSGIDWINGFTQYFGQYIPTHIPNMNNEEDEVAINTVCRHEGRNPNRVYRKNIFRNGKQDGKQKHRTEYNGQLASIKFIDLYPIFKNDRTISFAFTDDPNLEKSEKEILTNFEENERKRKRT